MAPDHLAITSLSLHLMIGCLSLLALLAVVAYVSRFARALKRASRHLEAGSFGSIIGAVAGFLALLGLALSSWIELDDEQLWIMVAFVAGGAWIGACTAVSIGWWRRMKGHHDVP